MKNRIEHKTSRTAETTCSIRASSFYENEPCLKTDDYIAPKLLPRVMMPLIKMKIMRTIIKNALAPAGIYEYVIARTKFIDLLVLESLKNGFNQIVIIGAGFDSRAIRFCQKNPKAIFFELDAAITQTAKRNQLQKRKINIPKTVVFIPIDFNKESMVEMLEQYQFKKTEKTLFILKALLCTWKKKRYTIPLIH